MGIPEVSAPGSDAGWTTGQVMETTARDMMETYRPEPISLVRGRGTRVWDAEGNVYLDFVAGIAVNVVGHAHPRVVGAIQRQAERLIHCSNLYYSEPQARLAARLVALSPFDRVFFCNSGTEANEAAIKLARRFAWQRAEEPGGEESAPYEVITVERSFHGRTMGALAATAQVQYQKGFGPTPAGFRSVAGGDIEALAGAVTDRTCAVMLEPIQGESGIRPLDPGYLQAVRRLCDERGLLLIMDEVQTGMGRTGRWFAFEHAAIEPDICTLAKALGSGVPIGAVLATERVGAAFTPGTHGSTFGGNPLATAAALAVLETIEDEGLSENAARMGHKLREGFQAIADRRPVVREVRGRGLMLGVELTLDAGAVREACRRRGLLVNAIGSSVIRLLPPLNVTDDEAFQAVDILEQAFAEVASGE